MNKRELSEEFRRRMGCTADDAYYLTGIFLDCLRTGLVETGMLKFLDLFSIKVVKSKKKIGQNMQIHVPVRIPERQRLKIKPGKIIKDMMNANELVFADAK